MKKSEARSQKPEVRMFLFCILYSVFCILISDAYAGQNLFLAAGIEEIKEKPHAIEFTLKSMDGEMVSLKDLRGKVVLLNFWATWCPPCRIEMPDMEVLYKRYKDKGLVLLAVNLQESAKTVKRFVEKNGYTFTILLDSNGDVSSTYNAMYLPTTYIIDKDGRLVGRAMGAREWNNDAIKNLTEELLK